VVCGAEPPVKETMNSIERKTDTMKTYLLRKSKSVEAQDPPVTVVLNPDTVSVDRPLAATVEAILARPDAAHKGRLLFIGLDVHSDTIAVSLAPSQSTEVRRYGIIGGTHDDVLKAVGDFLRARFAVSHPPK
jgi:hypothetical protein